MTRTHPTDSGNLVVDSMTIGAGGLTIAGDLDVAGSTTLVSATTSGQVIIDLTNAEALLVRQDGDTGDIFTVNTTSGVSTFGSAATGHMTATAGDVMIGGELEVDGTAWFDGLASFYGTITFSGGSYGSIRQGVDDGIKFCLTATNGLANHHMIVTSEGNAAKDHDHETPSTDPTLFIHSATDPDTVNTQWLSFAHDQTDAVITSGLGNIKLSPASGVEITAGNLTLPANVRIVHSLATGSIGMANTSQTVETPFLYTGATSNQWVIAEYADRAFNFAHTQQTNPTMYIHSANQATDEWISLTHDQTNALIDAGTGVVEFGKATTTSATATALGGFIANTTAGVGYQLGGAGEGMGFRGITDQGTSLSLGVDGYGNNSLIITSDANKAKSHDHDTMQTNPTVYIHSATDPDTANTEYLALTHNQDNGLIGTGKGGIIMTAMIIGTQGTDVASANDATLTSDGNYFDVTGTTQTNTLSVPAGVTAGTFITLQFDANPVVKHATGGAGAQFALNGAADFASAAGDTLSLVYDGTVWRETGRKI